MIDVFTRIVLAGAFIFTFAWVVLAQRRTIKRLSDAYLRLTHFQRVVVALAVIVCTVYAQKPSTNDVSGVTGTNDVEIVIGGDTNDVVNGSGEAASSPLLLRMLPPLTSGETPLPHYIAPCRLESVSTNSDISYAMPADGSIRGTWHLTGAYEDVQKIGLEGLGGETFKFPLGNQLCTSLWAYTWGKVRPQLTNASNEIAAVGVPMSAIPEVSRFWTAATSNDTYLLTWENFAAGRIIGEAESFPLYNGIEPPLTSGQESASPFLNAQIELKRNGDFITRSNEVECVYRRVNPDDWDGDGLPNAVDLRPQDWDGDWFGPDPTLPANANADAYCWVDLVVPDANALVAFDGDGPSDHADPYFIARANETNRVPLLIGKSYNVRCARPFDIVGTSDPEIDVWRDCWSGELCIQWPVTMEFVTGGGLLAAPRLGSPSGPVKRPRVTPDWLNGAFSFGENFCCVTVGADGKDPVFYCNGDCGCGGCSTGDVIYRYEGYSLLFGERLDCGCVPLPVSQVSLAGPAYLVYESASTNGLPLDSEPVAYTLDASYQLRENGTLTLSCDCAEAVTVLDENGESVTLPCSWDASSSVLDQWQHRYFTVRANGGDRAGLLGEFTLEYGGENSAYAFATCESMLVRVWIEAVETWPTNRARHVYGPLEEFKMYSELNCGSPRGKAPFAAGVHFVPMQFRGFTYNCPIQVVHPQGVRGEFVREMTDADWDDADRDPLYPSVVGAGFVARWYLMPGTVSFKGLRVYEDYAPMDPKWGCFTDESAYPPAYYEHNMRAGAGTSLRVESENLIGDVDYVCTQLGVPPSCDGGYTLSIPLCWWKDGHDGHFPLGTVVQQVTVSSNGTTTISKGGLSTTRGVSQ